jgi:hypothetical protein
MVSDDYLLVVTPKKAGYGDCVNGFEVKSMEMVDGLKYVKN